MGTTPSRPVVLLPLSRGPVAVAATPAPPLPEAAVLAAAPTSFVCNSMSSKSEATAPSATALGPLRSALPPSPCAGEGGGPGTPGPSAPPLSLVAPGPTTLAVQTFTQCDHLARCLDEADALLRAALREKAAATAAAAAVAHSSTTASASSGSPPAPAPPPPPQTALPASTRSSGGRAGLDRVLVVFDNPRYLCRDTQMRILKELCGSLCTLEEAVEGQDVPRGSLVVYMFNAPTRRAEELVDLDTWDHVQRARHVVLVEWFVATVATAFPREVPAPSHAVPHAIQLVWNQECLLPADCNTINAQHLATLLAGWLSEALPCSILSAVPTMPNTGPQTYLPPDCIEQGREHLRATRQGIGDLSGLGLAAIARADAEAAAAAEYYPCCCLGCGCFLRRGHRTPQETVKVDASAADPDPSLPPLATATTTAAAVPAVREGNSATRILRTRPEASTETAPPAYWHARA